MKKHNPKNEKIPTPFVCPDNYFENFSEKLHKRIAGNIEPEKVSKKLPFGVPENYFELLPQRIMKRIASLNKKVWYQEQRTWQWAVAACSVVFLVWIGLNVASERTKSPTEEAEKQLVENLEKLDKQELEQYLVANHYKEIVFEELQNTKIPIQTQVIKDDAALFRDLNKDDLEQAITEDFLREIIEDEMQNEINPEKKDTI